MKVSDRLCDVIRALGLVEETASFEVIRIYGGGWAWEAVSPQGLTICGSQSTMTQVVRGHRHGKLKLVPYNGDVEVQVT